MSEGFNNNGHYADAIALHRSSEKDSRQYPALESLKLGRAGLLISVILGYYFDCSIYHRKSANHLVTR